jgi:pimeloyl-ACP methyl ester carboxylesterase
LLGSALTSADVLGRVDRSDGVGNDRQEGALLDSVWSYILGLLTRYVNYPVRSFQVTYRTTDAAGQSQVVSALVVVPYQLNSTRNLNLPIFSYQHPTQVERQYSPSFRTLADNELSYQAALLIASTGYIVVAADYPGLGVNHDVHPYCQQALANCVVDLLPIGQNHPDPRAQNTTWNGQTVLFGYSEGGYASLVAARELQRRAQPPTAVLAADGPHSLSDSMRNVILQADTSYSSPYFLPYVISAYDSVYASSQPIFSYFQAIIGNPPGYQPTPGSSYAQELRNLLSGASSGEQINDLIRLAQPYQGPRSILSASYLAQLQDSQSDLVRILATNNSYQGWLPNFPLRLLHNAFDDLVPVGNSRLARSAFEGSPSVQLVEYTQSLPGFQSIHAGSFPVALVEGYLWLDSQVYPNR